ncbi:MAG: PD40 domain-containing protein, partial [Gemmatimonadetes bacterium]|nr:PD40 domain-containing protein [Gemmatimonadota bacterium]
ASGAVDHRADLYSWGVMAWEVLAGRPPFAGSSMQQLFVQHLTATPEPLTTARPEVPPALAEAVMRCLAKNASDRFATADELLAHLDLAQASGSHAPVAATSHRAWVIGTGVVAAAAVAGALLLRDRDDPWGALRALPIPGDVGVAALSPAGTTVAFTRRGTPGVWVQPIDSVAERQVSREPTPQVGFVDDTTLLTLRVQRGNLVPARFVHTRTSAAKAPAFPLDSTGTWSWSDPGFITHLTVDTIAANQHAVVVSRLSLTGMIDSVRQELDVGERPGYVAGTAGVPGYVLASMLADSSLRFSRLEPGRPRRVVGAVAPNDSLRQKLANRMRLTLDGRYGDVWLSRDTIARFDLRKPDAGYTLKVHPLPAPLGGRARTGDALVHANDRASELWRVPIPADPAHQASMVSRTQGDVTEAALSPDQQVIARVIHPLGPATSLFVQGVEGGPLRWLIRSPGNLTGIRWSPDGAHLAVRETVRRIPPRWVIVDVRDGKVTRLGPIKSTWPVGATPSSYPPVWARDGNALYATSLDTLAPEIRRFALAEGDTGTVVYRGTRIPSLLDGLALHPDGTSLAVGGDELLVIPLDGGRPRTVLPLDTTVYRVPFLYQANGTIAFATVDEAARRTGAEPGLRELFTVSDRGGPIRPSGSLPTTCRYHIGLLRGDSLATCFNVRQVSERSIMHAGRH